MSSLLPSAARLHWGTGAWKSSQVRAKVSSAQCSPLYPNIRPPWTSSGPVRAPADQLSRGSRGNSVARPHPSEAADAGRARLQRSPALRRLRVSRRFVQAPVASHTRRELAGPRHLKHPLARFRRLHGVCGACRSAPSARFLLATASLRAASSSIIFRAPVHRSLSRRIPRTYPATSPIPASEIPPHIALIRAALPDALESFGFRLALTSISPTGSNPRRSRSSRYLPRSSPGSPTSAHLTSHSASGTCTPHVSRGATCPR